MAEKLTGAKGLLLSPDVQREVGGIINDLPYKFANPLVAALNKGWQDEWMRVSEVEPLLPKEDDSTGPGAVIPLEGR